METIYLSGVSNDTTREAAQNELYGQLGVLLGPATYGGEGCKIDYTSHIPDYAAWALDNGCFTNKGEFDGESWIARLDWIINNIENAHESIRFAVAPDVFDNDKMQGDMAATIERSRPWFQRIRNAGAPAALVIQDTILDMDLDSIPWDEFDVAFMGGGDGIKLGFTEKKGRSYVYDRFNEKTVKWAQIITRIHAEGKALHMGRVNSQLRLALSNEIHADTADGTFLAFAGADNGMRQIRNWFGVEPVKAQSQMELFTCL